MKRSATHPAPSPEPARALTVDDASRMYRIGKTKLYELMAAGELPYVKKLGRRRIQTHVMDRLAFDLPPKDHGL